MQTPNSSQSFAAESEANSKLFRSFFIGGFECSTMRLRSRGGDRLDMVAATRHDRFALQDYQRLAQRGIHTTREGIRWHLIETSPYVYDLSSVLAQLRAAQTTGAQVIWDLFHYGYPDDLDIFKPEFVTRFAALARRFAEFLRDESDDVPFIAPINEPSFFSWIGGRIGHFAPFKKRRANTLKLQLMRAAIAATEAALSVNPRTRVCHIDPIINVVPNTDTPSVRRAAQRYRLSQYECWDMIAGYRFPELGGDPRYLDIIGANYYRHNQWTQDGTWLEREDPRYRPLGNMLTEVYERYRRPVFLAETGIEDAARPDWLRCVSEQVRAAQAAGADLHGICLYPIVNFPGWDNDRHCHNGLWDYADEQGDRAIYEPLATELARQQNLFALHAFKSTAGASSAPPTNTRRRSFKRTATTARPRRPSIE